MRIADKLKLVWSWLIVMWASAAWAAEVTFVSDLASIPSAAVAVSALLSFMGGAASTASKFADASTVVKNVWLEIVKDILLSVLAGLLTFFLTTWMGWPTLLQAFSITVAGYGGSRVMERYLTNLLDRLSAVFAARIGSPPP